MATERLSMRKLREILRLHHESKLSARAIARSCGTSSSTVLKYLGRAAVAKVTWPVPAHLDDIALERLLFPDEGAPVRQRPEPDWELVHRELKRKHVTKMLVWQEYREAVPNRLPVQPVLRALQVHRRHNRLCCQVKAWSGARGQRPSVRRHLRVT